jgi:hypothetical protein
MTRWPVLLLALLLASSVTPRRGLAQSSCPPDGPRSRDLVARFLTRAGFGSDRVELGLDGATMAGVRVLADATDAAACQQLAAAVDSGSAGPNWRWTGYRVGNYYFVAFRRSETATGKWLGFVPLYIFDTSFRQVRGMTM